MVIQRLRNERTAVLNEFRRVLSSGSDRVPVETDAIMVLAVRPEQDQHGHVTRHDTPENHARIGFGVRLFNQVTAARRGALVPDDHASDDPLLILNGEDEQFPMMVDVALALGALPGQLVTVACGPIGTANTKTQFEVLRAQPWLERVRHLTLVTTGYHVPRVRRTATIHLPAGMKYVVLPVPYENYRFSVFKVRGEIRRILQYAARGDIAAV